jgi:hypothetical protein
MERAMIETQTPTQTNSGAPRVSGFAKGATIAGAMTWALALLALLTAGPHSFGDQLVAFLFLAVATLFLLFVALPSVLISYARR